MEPPDGACRLQLWGLLMLLMVCAGLSLKYKH